jgi:hypothetical protein
MDKPTLTITGLEMPVDFPREPYESVSRLVEPLAEHQQIAWAEFGGAWNAVSYRFMAVCQYGDLLQKLGRTDLAPMERYEEEKCLFGFFVSAYATFESAIYGTFAIGSLSDAQVFPIETEEDRKRINASQLLKKLTPFNAPIAKRIEEILKSDPYQELKQIRNVLYHRTAPGRIFTPEDAPPVWRLNETILDRQMVGARRADFTLLLGTFLEATHDLAKTLEIKTNSPG